MKTRLTASEPPAKPQQPSLWNRLGRALWRPGMRVMSALHMPGKLTVVVGVLAAPLCFFLARDISVALNDIQQIKAAVAGVNVTKAAIRLNYGLNNLATLTQARLAGDKALTDALTAERQRVEVSAKAMQAAIDAASESQSYAQWPGIQRHVERLAQQSNHLTALEAQTDFDLVLSRLRDLQYQAANRTGIVDIAGVGASDLVKLMAESVAKLVDATSDVKRHGVIILARPGEADPTHVQRVVGLSWSIQREIQSAQTLLTSLARLGMDSPGSWAQAVELVEQQEANSLATLTSANPSGSAAAFHDKASVLVDQLVNVQLDSANRLLALIEQKRTQRWQQTQVLAALWVFGILLIAYVVTVYLLSSWGGLRRLTKAMQATAAGDFSHRVVVGGQDELTALAQAFDDMNERLSNHTSDIRSRAARVDQSSRQVAQGNQQLAERTDQQAESVNNTLRAFAEVATAVNHNAKATRELDELTEQLFTQAEAGNAAMAETVVAMHDLDGASGRVAEMVAVIEDVAFQTGMLALNASVEAARAGPSGKGFAVVADEVRQLSHRCAEAADEIRTLTQTSASKLHESSDKLQHVSVSIDQLVNGVREVSGQLRSIATASTQQEAALAEVEANMESIGSITRDNAALVEQSSSATHTLLSLGEDLTSSVVGMRLRHGSADEAQALVDQAIAYAKEHGRAKALAHFNAEPQAWVDRDLFIFSLDRSGIILANAMTPGRIGTSVDMLDGLRGTHHSERLWDCVNKHGSGWVRYKIVHPVTGALQAKESFVSGLDTTTLIGCGCYSKVADEPSQDATPEGTPAKSRLESAMA